MKIKPLIRHSLEKKKNRYNIVLIVALVLTNTLPVNADTSNSAVSKQEKLISVEYLSPTENDRDIETLNVDYSVPVFTADTVNLMGLFVITGTYATGTITQLEGELSAGTLREVSYDNTAFGIGPGGALILKLFYSRKWNIYFNLVGNIMLYNERFPAGGDYYNFMRRFGPVVEYNIGNAKAIGLSYQRSHVSNGQGLGPENPSYEAHGIAFRFRGFF